jgi:hypothetical protein
MPNRAHIGDIIEIPTSDGLAYAQYTHQHATRGGLIRVFEPLFSERPKDFSSLITKPIRFSTFFPVRAAINRGVFKIVAHEQIAPHNQAFPVFRGGSIDPQTKKVHMWWFWDGERSWKVGKITSEHRKLPIEEVWTAPLLIDRIQSGWTSETDSR